MRAWRRSAAVVAVVSLVALIAGCSIETAGAPKGSVQLTAHFEDVQDLTPGHNVQASNVVVGSVREIRLDGYEAEVEVSIVDSFRMPVGTAAVVRRTSLLGEYYVDLVLPDAFDPAEGPFLADGDEIGDATTQPDVEQLAEQAAAVVGSLTADDLGASLEALSVGLGGRGDTLNQLVRDAGLVADALADQQVPLAETVDNLAVLGQTLAPRAGDLATTLDRLATASGTLADSRDRMVAALDAVVALATATNDTVLEPHAERLATMLQDLNPLLGGLASQSDVIAGLMVDLDRFVKAFPTAVHNGNVLLLAWAYVPGALRDLDGSLGAGPLSQLIGALGVAG